jgi:xylan 1,4-beta-xylosidase
MYSFKFLPVVALGCGLAVRALGAENSFPVSISIDASQAGDSLKPVWRFFGADEPN